jgi:hypothetical protein
MGESKDPSLKLDHKLTLQEGPSTFVGSGIERVALVIYHIFRWWL